MAVMTLIYSQSVEIGRLISIPLERPINANWHISFISRCTNFPFILKGKSLSVSGVQHHLMQPPRSADEMLLPQSHIREKLFVSTSLCKLLAQDK